MPLSACMIDALPYDSIDFSVLTLILFSPKTTRIEKQRDGKEPWILVTMKSHIYKMAAL